MTGTAREQVRNPLRYTCAANHAGPDYAAAHNFADFVGYCLQLCWVGSDGDPGDDLAGSWPRPLDRGDVCDLRRQFLERLEEAVWLHYDAQLEEETDSEGWLDFGGDYVSVSNAPSEGEDDEEKQYWVDLAWSAQWQRDEGVLRFELSFVIGPDGPTESPDVAWLDLSALDDRDEVLRVFSQAYATVNGQPWWPTWQRHVEGAPGFDWDKVHRDLRQCLERSGFVFPSHDPTHVAIAADYLSDRGQHGLAELLRNYYKPPDVRGLVLPGDTP